MCVSVKLKWHESPQSKWSVLLFLLFASPSLLTIASETYSRRISDEILSIYKRKV